MAASSSHGPAARSTSLIAISRRVENGSACLRWINCSTTFGTTVDSRMTITLTATRVSTMG